MPFFDEENKINQDNSDGNLNTGALRHVLSTQGSGKWTFVLRLARGCDVIDDVREDSSGLQVQEVLQSWQDFWDAI